ncbi:TetR/AcrR family transcriptional regulator [Nonomuraea sp. LPB2021202275-12-8]|uniref:TetR/AcrR family transcriptional regulator n=1 Tax=Nonomuraea sp. LPB2021202275-12-8 TaxID=3120159 RepID=UPI00300D176C
MMRADARRNRERIVASAREVFAEQGPGASLNQVAQRAGVGAGTLYRHFPTSQDLLVEIIKDDVDALCARGRELADHPSPGEALRTWLRAVAVHATAMRGLVAVEMAGAGPALAACHDQITATGAALLHRARPPETASPAGQAGAPRVDDLLTLANAIGWAAEQSPGDERLIDRLLALVTIPGTRKAPPPE